MKNVVMEDNDDGHATPWWARIAIDQGTLEWKRPLRVDAHARLDMQNIRLLIALFSSRTQSGGGQMPKWVLRLIDSGAVHAEGDVRLRGNDVTLDRVKASNDRFELNARLHAGDGHTDGDLYMHWGVLGLGIELHNGQRKFHLAGAKGWYFARPDLLPASRGIRPMDSAGNEAD